jgi:hypothetical protein
VVDAERGDAAGGGLLEHVGGVEAAAEADLDRCTASAGWRAKARKVAAVVTSKKLGPSASPVSSTSLSSAASSSSETSLPAMRMRSL